MKWPAHPPLEGGGGVSMIYFKKFKSFCKYFKKKFYNHKNNYFKFLLMNMFA